MDEDQSRNADGNVDPEHRAPRHLFGEDTTEQRADGEEDLTQADVDGHGAASFLDSERAHDDDCGDRHHQRGSDTLQRTCGDQPALANGAVRRETAGCGRQEERDHADPEGGYAAKTVGDLASDGHQRRNGQDVGVDHPLLAGG